MAFQWYAGWRVQRFQVRSPNCSSFDALGWIRITSYIDIKKLVFLDSMIVMDESNIVKEVFMSRVSKYLDQSNTEVGSLR